MRKQIVAALVIALLLMPITLAQGRSLQINQEATYKVTRVIDGDTIEVKIDGKKEKVRLIGIDSPETKDPRKPVQCFGIEAAAKMKQMVQGKAVKLEADPTNSDRDKYKRLLRYVYLKDGTLVNEHMVKEGYAFAYLDFPFEKMDEFKADQKAAESGGKGLWNANTCAGKTAASVTMPAKSTESGGKAPNCEIKGNISTSGEKIYHMPGGAYYDKTVIDESAGERWFCGEDEAKAAGWRRIQR